MILYEVIIRQRMFWVLDDESGAATKTICEETGATFNGPLPAQYQASAATLADFALPRQSANLRARLAHVGATP